MDERDKRILSVLLADARTTYSALAKTLSISEAAIRKRVRNLETSGVIQRYTLHVDPSALGFDACAIIGIDTDPDALARVQGEVRRLKGVRYTSLSSGDHMLVFGAWCKDMPELRRMVSHVKSLRGVKKVCPAIMQKSLEYCD